MTEEETQDDETTKNPEPHGQDESPPDRPEGGGPADGEAEQLRKNLAEAQASADLLKDQLLRKAAEFENYKRRTESEFGAVIRNANEGLLLALIPILDDLVRSLDRGKQQKDYDAFYRGIELIYNKFSRILEQQGLVPFDSVGKPFDVDFHEALLQMPKDDVPPHTVIEETERGYKLNDRVLRHAKVIVSSAPEEPARIPNEDNEKQGSD